MLKVNSKSDEQYNTRTEKRTTIKIKNKFDKKKLT